MRASRRQESAGRTASQTDATNTNRARQIDGTRRTFPRNNSASQEAGEQSDEGAQRARRNGERRGASNRTRSRPNQQRRVSDRRRSERDQNYAIGEAAD